MSIYAQGQAYEGAPMNHDAAARPYASACPMCGGHEVFRRAYSGAVDRVECVPCGARWREHALTDTFGQDE